MNKTRLFVLPGILILLVAAFYFGLRVGGRSGPGPAAGDAPAGPGRTQDSVEEPADLSPSAVRLTPEKQRLIGVRVGAVEKKPFVHTLRVFGRVAADETKVYRLTASVDGWINDSFGYPVGSQVRKGAVLATFYSQQFLDAQQAFIYALDAGERLQTGQRIELSRSDIPQQAALDRRTIQRQIDQLRSLGMDDSQIEEIGRTRALTQSVRIVAPAGGFVLVRDVSPGQRFARGRRALPHRRPEPCLDPGRRVRERGPLLQARSGSRQCRLPYRPNAYRAVTSRALPIFDAGTRTLKVRLETRIPISPSVRTCSPTSSSP